MVYQTKGIVGCMIKSIIFIGAISLFFAFSSDVTTFPAKSKKETKISSALSNTFIDEGVEFQSSKSEHPRTLTIPQDAVKFDDEGMAQVYITLHELSQTNLEKLESVGVIIEIYDQSLNLVQARVEPDKIDVISGLPFVKFIDLPNYGYSNAGSVQTEGDAVLRADEARETFGVDGTGVKVGVISNGINGLTESLGSGDLPSSGVNIPSSPLTGGGISIDDPCPGFAPVTSTPAARPDVTTGAEGTAMLEIIHDIAPGAELFFASGSGITDLEHRRARRCLTEVVNIITDDVAFFNAGSYDGSSAVSQESTASVLAGVANFISVGNYALVHYQGMFTDTDGDSFHEFDLSLGLPFTDNSGETLNITILPLEVVTIHLQWDDSFGASGNDYNLALITPADPSSPEEVLVLFSSVTPQDGDDNPTEGLFSIINNGLDPITVGIVIENFDAEMSKEFDMFVLFSILPVLDEFIVTQSSVPNNSDADLVLSIGSIGLEPGNPLVQGIDEIRSYSSQGPTNDGRMKPEFVAPDGVSVTGAGGFSSPFFGTSAAAPHAAGVAALLLQADEELTPSEISSVLQQTSQSLSPTDVSDILSNTAVDLGTPGPDNTFGFGRIDAFAAVQSIAQQPTPTPLPTPSATPSPQPPPTDQEGDGSGGCSISPTAQVGTAVINILIPLLSALVIAFRIFRKTI